MLKLKWETDFKSNMETGSIPKDWEYKELEAIAYIDKRVKNVSKSNKIAFIAMKNIPTDSYVPSFEIKKDLKEVRSGKEVLPNSILMAKITPSFEHGKMCIVPNVADYRWFATTEVFMINPKDHNDLKFIFYVLKHPNLREILENSMSGASGRQRVQLSALKSLKVPYPGSSERLRIGTVLSWFDDLIENKKRQNEILEKTAMTIFKNWFIDFEPFKDSEFVDSELGKIPRKWEVRSLIEIGSLFKGVSYESSDISSEPCDNLFITLNNFLRGGGFKPEYKYYIGSNAKERHKVREGDLIIALTDVTAEAKVVGAPALVVLPHGYNFGIISLDCAKFMPTEEYLKFYLYLYLKYTQQDNATFANGVNVLHLNTKLFMKNKLILIPPKPIIEKFNLLVVPLFQKIFLNHKQLMILRKIRDVLLPLLVFGRVRVEEI